MVYADFFMRKGMFLVDHAFQLYDFIFLEKSNFFQSTFIVYLM